jgi:hypothetical protein
MKTIIKNFAKRVKTEFLIGAKNASYTLNR